MRYFAKLLEDLIFTYSINKKIDILVDYYKKANVIDRGFTIAILTGKLSFKNTKKSNVLNVIKDNIDNYLFQQSYDYVGDLAETISMIWPKNNYLSNNISLSDVIIDLKKNSNSEQLIFKYLNIFEARENWAFIKLLLGRLRIGVSASLVKKSLAKYGHKELNQIENIWNGLEPPYESLFLWLENKAEYPSIEPSKIFHSFMLATVFDKNLIKNIEVDKDFFLEYKWDGIRVQIVALKDTTKIYSRSGDDITTSFPEIKIQTKELLVLDGEMLVGKNFKPFSFNLLQKRINKKSPSKMLKKDLPAFVKVYDVLFANGKDMRNKPLFERRIFLENWFENNKYRFLDLSELIKYKSYKNLLEIHKKFTYIEGLMVKKKTSIYVSGRKKGFWYKWKRDPRYIDAILMYAQRGHGKRSSYYSDYTVGIWLKNSIVPIAKAYSGYTDNELNKIDKFVRKNTIAKYGPVREVKKSLVIEIAFDAAQISSRHKSGISLRFPRISRVRWDKPIDQVLNLDELKKELINNC